MATIVRCSCGEGFDVHDSRAGQQVPCPACGPKLDIPSHPAVSLSSANYVGPGAGWNPSQGVPTGDDFEKLPLCPNCRGSGVCSACKGAGARDYERWNWHAIATFLLFGFWAWAAKGWQQMIGLQEHASSGRCVGCNGNGKCYKCTGYGRLLG
ncbi:MAG: hypothetical protein K2R98_01295 [Gemmataceae bacterium]|nr:hypothetical protein [Gemmataceae bacterium]